MAIAYDLIGTTYARTRRPDPRLGAQILAALGDARSVVNVGAGSGSYEPSDRRVVAVEPSATLIEQRPTGSAPAIQAAAEHLPLADASVDAAMAVLTIHHWADPARGLAEMRRVARQKLVVLTWDQGPERGPRVTGSCWNSTSWPSDTSSSSRKAGCRTIDRRTAPPKERRIRGRFENPACGRGYTR
jgi:SAM-dependent methyltransferase